MADWLKILVPVLLVGLGVIFVGIYNEIRTLDKTVMSREVIDLRAQHLMWRLEKLEEKAKEACP
jgi:hypothetical protein